MSRAVRIIGLTLSPLLVGCGAAAAQAGPSPAPDLYEVSAEHAAAVTPQEAPQAAPFIQVSGSAEVQVPADRARLSFAVETEAPTARAASQQNAERMDAVVAALRELVGADGRVETWGYSLQPRYRYREGQAPAIQGYQAINHVRVTVDDVTGIGRLIDAGIAAGANRIAGLDFEARDTEAARMEAVRQAVQKARTEAAAIAEALGVPLGPPLEVHGGAEMPPPRPMYDMAVMREQMASAPTTPIEPGQQTVRANVTVKYRIGAP